MTPSVNQAVLTHIVQALKEGQIRYCESLGFSPQELCELTRLTADDILFLSNSAVQFITTHIDHEMLGRMLAEITGDSGKTNFNVDTMKSDRALWVVAKDENGEAIGCGAIRPISEDIAELKRMFSVSKASGTGTALLRYFEGEAKSLGYNEIRLETRKVNTRAVAFYVKHNYQRIANYGPYVGKDEAVCFSKHLSLKEI